MTSEIADKSNSDETKIDNSTLILYEIKMLRETMSKIQEKTEVIPVLVERIDSVKDTAINLTEQLQKTNERVTTTESEITKIKTSWALVTGFVVFVISVGSQYVLKLIWK